MAFNRKEISAYVQNSNIAKFASVMGAAIGLTIAHFQIKNNDFFEMHDTVDTSDTIDNKKNSNKTDEQIENGSSAVIQSEFIYRIRKSNKNFVKSNIQPLSRS
jgi:hypothetical protein